MRPWHTIARSATAVGVLAAGASLPGCHAWNHLLGNDTVDLSKANVQSMSVDIRKDRKTICPREPVQMAVFADVVLEGEKDKKSFETWSGHGSVNKNDKIDFVDFAFHSDQGDFDGQGWFSPAHDVLSTADKEFEIKTVYKRQPDKFSFTTKYKPDYQCIKDGGKTGAPGSAGSNGPAGSAGQDGSSGSDSQAGGAGTSGGSGGPGGDGGSGAAGPRIAVYATMVKTPFYDKLVAIKLTGDVDDFLLVPIDQPVAIHAAGGPGGSGGTGGMGGRGGAGGGGNPGGQGGQGGAGGNGGKGGAGGAGGTIDLTYDAHYPELANAMSLDVGGGAGGNAGPGGTAGEGGGGGAGITPSGAASSAPSGPSGGDGPQGASGAQGQRGPDGHASVHSGPVDDRFGGLPGVTLLDGAGAGAPAAAPDPPAKAPKPGGKGTSRGAGKKAGT